MKKFRLCINPEFELRPIEYNTLKDVKIAFWDFKHTLIYVQDTLKEIGNYISLIWIEEYKNEKWQEVPYNVCDEEIEAKDDTI